MTIPITRYVDITSGIGAGTNVARRELICRMFTSNPNLPSDLMEFTDLNSLADVLTTGSEEYRRAQFYFAFVSKNITRPQRISVARWARTALAPKITSGSLANVSISTIQTIDAGAFTLRLGSQSTQTQSITAIDLSSAASLSAVATVLQTRIRAATAGGTSFTNATVTFNAQRNQLEITSGATGANPVSIIDGADTPAAILNLLPAGGAIFSPGKDVTSITDTLAQSAEANNNFGSFIFVDDLTEEQTTEAARWNDGNNVLFQYYVPVTAANASTYSTNLIGFAGTGLILDSDLTDNEYPEMLPAAILAATDYTRRAAVQNYMFQTAALTPTVTTNAAANLYDGLRVNYYGETQTAGQIRRFFQRGVLTGDAGTDPVDMNIFANEQWLKDDAGARIMSLLLSLPRLSANQEGRTQVLNILQGTIDQALLNGTISVFRDLTAIQRTFIIEQTNSEDAPFQVQNAGYWVDATIRPVTTSDNRTEFEVTYTLIYLKDDVIRKVTGTHALI